MGRYIMLVKRLRRLKRLRWERAGERALFKLRRLLSLTGFQALVNLLESFPALLRIRGLHLRKKPICSCV
jgi:hypothetical protein